MRKILSFLRDLLTVVIVMAVAFGAGCFYGIRLHQPVQEEVVDEVNEGFDLELPLEVERRVVTVEDVESKLVEIGELSTYSGEYKCTFGRDESRYWLDKIPVLFSTNSIEITCDGIVKVGYNMSDIVVKVDDDKIYISIPEARLNDNYVIWDSVVCNESNNIFNPIEFSQYEEIIEEIERRGLEDVTEQGIYDRAEDNLKVLIENFLAEFEEYEIVYM